MDEIDAIDSTEKPPSRLKNTFAPYCENEYFTPATLTGLCRYGFPYEQLPKEGKQMVDGYMIEYGEVQQRRRELEAQTPASRGKVQAIEALAP